MIRLHVDFQWDMPPGSHHKTPCWLPMRHAAWQPLYDSMLTPNETCRLAAITRLHVNSQWGMPPGSLCWGYYPGTLSCSLKIGHQLVTSKDGVDSNGRLMMLYCVLPKYPSWCPIFLAPVLFQMVLMYPLLLQKYSLSDNLCFLYSFYNLPLHVTRRFQPGASDYQLIRKSIAYVTLNSSTNDVVISFKLVEDTVVHLWCSYVHCSFQPGQYTCI